MWLVGWHAPAETLIRGVAWWVNFLRKLKLTLNEPIDASAIKREHDVETTNSTSTTTTTTTTTTTANVNNTEHH